MFKDISSERQIAFMDDHPPYISWVVYNLPQNEIKYFQSLMHSV